MIDWQIGLRVRKMQKWTGLESMFTLPAPKEPGSCHLLYATMISGMATKRDTMLFCSREKESESKRERERDRCRFFVAAIDINY